MTLSPADVIALHLGDVTYPEAHPRAGAQGEVYAFVIRHGDGAILVDTGIGGATTGSRPTSDRSAVRSSRRFARAASL